MLTWLTKRWRLRAALTMAALYAVCVMAPPVALAFTNGSAAAHCLTDDHHTAAHVHGPDGVHDHGTAHAHADGTVHQHGGDAGASGGDEKQTAPASGCCGLFCFAALTGDAVIVPGYPVLSSPVLAAIDESVAGRGPDRINRPPIALQSL